MTIEAFAAAKADLLSRRLSFQMNRARKQGDAASIHDLRVALRRLEACRRIFRRVLPKKARKQTRRVRQVRKAAGQVRNIDIALELLGASKCPGDDLRRRLVEARRAARKELACLL